jgi:hypothetical protein
MKNELHPETKAFILQQECASINNNGFDTDLSLYYELFKNGNKEGAKNLYRNSLEKKYPYEDKRVELMRCYRTKDPRFPYVYTDAINELADRLAFRISAHIDGIINCFSDIGPDPMSVLKAIQKTLRQFFPSGQDAAYDMIERLEAYSSAMNYREIEFLDAADLLKGYIDNSIFKTDEELREAKEKQDEEIERSIEERDRKRAERTRHSRKRYVIDLRKVQFSREDLAEIRIDSRLKRKAHKVLAYCKLYWQRINDPDFERKIFLYSKKYNTKHYDIFRTIKDGRLRNAGDDVLLLEVFNHLSLGYEYSISEDLYMRQVWQRIKPFPVSAPAADTRRKTKPAAAAKPAAAETGPPKQGRPPAAKKPAAAAKPAAEVQPAAPEPKPAAVKKPVPAPAEPKPPAAETKPAKQERPPAPEKKQPAVRQPKEPKAAAKPAVKTKPPAAPTPAAESLQRKVDKLPSGPFKNYHRLFRTKLVTFIEEYLIRDAITLGNMKLEEKGLEEAKDQIHRFIMDNYGRADYDWTRSPERKKVEDQGFLVPELYTITTRCYNAVKDASVSEEYKRMARR